MAEKKLVKNRIWMVGLIAVLGAFSAGLITAVNILTKPRIALNEELKLKKSILNVLAIPYQEKEIIAIFDRSVKIKEVKAKPIYLYYDKENLKSVAFQMNGPGFWGPISALVALTADFNSIQGIEILHQEETPGLGGRITEDEFKGQFRNKLIKERIQVDAITGATMTSKAFTKIINESIGSFKENFQFFNQQ